jgi:hypothetical protein
MRMKHIEWAKAHVNMTAAYWHKVIFSDESKININGSDGMQYVRRRKGEELLPE